MVAMRSTNFNSSSALGGLILCWDCSSRGWMSKVLKSLARLPAPTASRVGESADILEVLEDAAGEASIMRGKRY
jgi:hypothetical protein